MSDGSAQVLETLLKIHGLLELLAEDKIAARDAKQRKMLLDIVGSSVPMQKSVLLMNGMKTQKEISFETGANQGHLSTLVGKLRGAALLAEDAKNPTLIISIPRNFFENGITV